MKDDRLKRAVIKEELVDLTGSFTKAVVLQQMLYWSERVKDFDKFVAEEFERATAYSDGQPLQELFGIPKTHGWVYKTAEQLSDETMLHVSPQTMRRYLKDLIDLGYIEERRNPKYNWDRTMQYRVNVLKVQVDLFEKGYALDGYSIQLMTHLQNGDTISKSEIQTMENRETIPEITIENTLEIKKDTDGNSPSVTLNEDTVTLEESLRQSNRIESMTPEEKARAREDDDVGKSRFPSPLEKPSKYNFKKETVNDIKKNLSSSAQASKGVTCRSKPQIGARQKQQPKNSNTMIAHFNELFKEFFGGTPPVDLQKDRALLKKMIKHYDYEYTQSMLEWMFRNWAAFRREKKITGVPTVGLFWGFRAYFQEKVPYQEDEHEDAESF